MSVFERKDEKDDFWDLDKLIPKKKGSSLSPFVTKPTVTDYVISDSETRVTGESTREKRAEERKLTVMPRSVDGAIIDKVYYPENTLLKSITVKKYKKQYDFYDNFRKAALLYHECLGERCEFAQFFSFMPQYSQLNNAQKNYYLYWRNEMRHGNFIKTDYSYVYLYVYEVINLPDVIPPEDGVRLLCRLWREYRRELPRIDMYFSIWVRDYCLVHGLPCPISEIQDFIFDVIRISDFKEYYFTDIGAASRDGVWSLLAYLSDYDWHKGFYTVVGEEKKDAEYLHRADMYKTLLFGAMQVLLPSVWELCMKEKERGNLSKRSYSAFRSTLCTNSVKCDLEIEYYPLADASQLRAGITAAVRYTENKLRALYGAKSRLAVKNIPLEYRELIDGYFDNIIRKSENNAKRRNAPEYEKLYDAPREKLSFAGADEIERRSWDTTMRLCDTDEYIDRVSDDGDDYIRSSAKESIPRDALVDSFNMTVAIEYNTAENVNDASHQESDTYGLSESDVKYIASLIESSEQRRRDIDDEATVERINEAFSDGFGDVIIEDSGDGFEIIEDYKEEIKEWLKNI